MYEVHLFDPESGENLTHGSGAGRGTRAVTMA